MVTKTQTSLNEGKHLRDFGFLFIVLSLIFIALFSLFAVLSKDNGLWACSFVFGVLFIMGLYQVGVGTYYVNSYTKASILKETGKKDICEIVKIKIDEANYNRRVYNAHYNMYVKYKTESKEHYILNVAIDPELLSKVKENMFIECYIKENDCFVDTDNIVEVKDL